ncbi:hypothetical protein E2C01_044784 [Portunus trituberculatus]|uniref:Uncharacterized protein n=1 Tax=Portunus trituberculatus TaxID=210409 RepID=A0A5B7G0F0_PORTR|nr:hypothetical protein [Portunus trituberculatus]
MEVSLMELFNDGGGINYFFLIAEEWSWTCKRNNGDEQQKYRKKATKAHFSNSSFTPSVP